MRRFSLIITLLALASVGLVGAGCGPQGMWSGSALISGFNKASGLKIKPLVGEVMKSASYRLHIGPTAINQSTAMASNTYKLHVAQ